MRKLSVLLFLCLLVLLNLTPLLRYSDLSGIFSRLVNHQQPPQEALRSVANKKSSEGEHKFPQHVDDEVLNGRFLGGLLSSEFDETSCLSRYQSHSYRRTKARRPSSHLISRLRKYESLHKRCGPKTESYNKTLENLMSGEKTTNASYCKYIIWLPCDGLNNRLLGLASTFLYALLTDRVLLLGDGAQIQDLLCEPFPEVSWFLPTDFPMFDVFKSSHQKSPYCYGNMLKNNTIRRSRMPPFVHIYLRHDLDEDDKLFLCDQDQTLLENVPWLILRTNQYFLPALFLIRSFQQELNNLFPEKDTVFHHLGRYLFHPTNHVWGLVTRYYEAYLAKADETLGIQIRVFNDTSNGTLKHVQDQILECTLKENLLPEINKKESVIKKMKKQKTKAVLVTSLKPGYYEEIRNMYLHHPAVTGETVAVHQPSHEEIQQTGDQMHDRKALAEVFLLSMTDKLVTSAMSTFGYVAHSLGGLQPWILYSSHGEMVTERPCQRALSMEPCYHSAPTILPCKRGRGIATDNLIHHLRRCEDIIYGLKLFGHDH